ncbi:MAG: ABC transporter ATP-binding protein [Syntrophomonadaceae bacterium]|nr:ABC transporter ATP-binding protein [Syntrophomonadaceae bacterium]
MNNSLVKKAIEKVIKQNTGIMILLLITVCGVVLASLVPPQILRLIIDNHLVPKSSDKLLPLAVAYLAVLLFIGVFDFLKAALLTILGQKIMGEIRMEMMVKLESVNALFFTTNESGSIVSRFTNDVEAINSLFTSGVIGMMIDCLKIIGIVISIWLFSAALGMLTLILLPVIYAITRLFQKKMLQAQIDNRKLVARVNNYIAESFRNIQMIKAYSKESYMEQNYTERLLHNYETVEKVNFYDSIFSPIILLIRAVVIAIIVILSSEQLNYLGISLGMVAASIDLISNLFTPVEKLGMELQNIQQAIAGVQRVNDFYNEAEDDEKDNTLYFADIIPQREEFNLSFNDVNFQYERNNDVLQNINLNLHAQDKVAFTGRTGAGKSTLFKLVMGLLEPTSGSITINGIDVYSIPNREKRKIFGYVEQKFHMIPGSVADQISLQDESITRDQVENALEFVGLTDYVGTLENGLDTQLNNDNFFSQGQQQLLAIARAIVTNPPIILLDEITANLDSITEERVISVLQKAGAAHTILTISHRLSSMIASDMIVVLENGHIKNTGTAEMLWQNDDWYRSNIVLERLTWR